jgi:cytochrome c-type biogenesis protein CcmH/NrfG
MATESQPRDPKPRLSSRLEAWVVIPNLLLVAVVVLYFVMTRAPGGTQVAPLVEGERSTEQRIRLLERQLARNPGNTEQALELARLYQRVGEYPWSYDALRNAEAHGVDEPRWLMTLALAYLDLGKNKDAIRVLNRAKRRCPAKPGAVAAGGDASRETCDANLKLKLEIFGKLARIFEKRGIHSGKHYEAAEKALREILKPVEVDPDKMRPKAPVTPVTPEKAAVKKKSNG